MTICNPLNLSYRFQLAEVKKAAPCREAADPSVVFYKGEYWLFASKSSGYWRSSDLMHWRFVATGVLPTEDYAPDAAVVDGHVVVTASRRGEPCPVFRSDDPGADAWEHVTDLPAHWDPAIFQDDDGRVYRYWGCSDHEPLYGQELDRQTLEPIGEVIAVYHPDPQRYGWERSGDEHRSDAAPWIEGPWMDKHAGRYYLQYAGPGTEYDVYNDAVLIGDAPLGPFAMQHHNPLSYKPRGYATGAGHGSSFRDALGNWWHIATMRISVRHQFERRLGLFPAGFDRDGVMFCNTGFGDWPMRLPDGRWDPWRDAFAGWMLLSRGCRAEASSALPDHGPARAFDEDIRTCWAADDEPTPSLRVDIGEEAMVHAIQINFAEHNATLYGRGGEDVCYRYRVEASPDGLSWATVVERDDDAADLPHDYHELKRPMAARHVRLIVEHVPSGSVAVSGLRLFGRGTGEAPARPAGVAARRDGSDQRVMHVRWKPVDGATGYQVHWGIAPDKLYNACLVYDATELELRCLNVDQRYHVAVEAFNMVGIGRLSKTVDC